MPSSAIAGVSTAAGVVAIIAVLVLRRLSRAQRGVVSVFDRLPVYGSDREREAEYAASLEAANQVIAKDSVNYKMTYSKLLQSPSETPGRGGGGRCGGPRAQHEPQAGVRLGERRSGAEAARRAWGLGEGLAPRSSAIPCQVRAGGDERRGQCA
eukprot:m.126377 g.126377  ORF g.126377 m.126377 type:complete len:154 (-) comp13568_c2_seq2:808-1269(-)